MKKRLLSVLVGCAVLLGLAAVPAQSAEAASTGKLVVSLVSPSGKAVHDKYVRITLVRGINVVSAQTNSKGVATFTKLVASKKYIASTSEDSAYIDTTKKNVVVKAGKTSTLKLTYALGATISGTITDGTGAVLPDIVVQITHTTGLIPIETVSTNSNGVYRFVGLPTGKYRIFFNYSTGSSTNNNPHESRLTMSPYVVKQQSKTKKPISLKKQNASLTRLYEISGSTTQGSARAFVVTGAGTDIDYTTFSLTDASAGTTSGTTYYFDTYLPEGDYNFGLTNATTANRVWYVSDSSPSTTVRANATTITLTADTNIVIKPHA